MNNGSGGLKVGAIPTAHFANGLRSSIRQRYSSQSGHVRSTLPPPTLCCLNESTSHAAHSRMPAALRVSQLKNARAWFRGQGSGTATTQKQLLRFSLLPFNFLMQRRTASGYSSQHSGTG
ncbi:hypothetical protein SRHO_G00150270 [Serrasalmus rhombeus]